MSVEYSAKKDAQWSRSDAVRCSWGGNAGHARSKRFMPAGGWHIMLGIEMCPVLLSLLQVCCWTVCSELPGSDYFLFILFIHTSQKTWAPDLTATPVI